MENKKNIDYTTKVLEVKNLKQYFKIGYGPRAITLKAVDDVSFDIYKREVFGLVGESGCGKTTTGRSIIKLYNPTDGMVVFNGVRIGAGYRTHIHNIRRARKLARETIVNSMPLTKKKYENYLEFKRNVKEHFFNVKGIFAKRKADIKKARLEYTDFKENLYQESRRHMLSLNDIKYQKYTSLLAVKRSPLKVLKKDLKMQLKSNNERRKSAVVFFKATTSLNFFKRIPKLFEVRKTTREEMNRENEELLAKYIPLIKEAEQEETTPLERKQRIEDVYKVYVNSLKEEEELRRKNMKAIFSKTPDIANIKDAVTKIKKEAHNAFKTEISQVFKEYKMLLKKNKQASHALKNAPINEAYREKIEPLLNNLADKETRKAYNKILKDQKAELLKIKCDAIALKNQTIIKERKAIFEAKLDNKVRGPEHKIIEKFSTKFKELDEEILKHYRSLENYDKGQVEYRRLLDSIKSLKLEVNKQKAEQRKEIMKMRKEVNPIKIMSKMQMIFQDPIASLNPRMTVREIISEGLKIQGVRDRKLIDEKVYKSLELVGLVPEHAGRYPHEFSGGQRQRIGIARALVINPDFIIADEPISALDVSIQAQVINLLNELKERLDLTILFIAHDLSVVKYFSDRIAVMYFGKIMELTSSEELFKHPLHPYTKALLSAIPQPDPITEKKRERIIYNPQSHNYKEDDLPALREIRPGHLIYCSNSEFNEYLKEFKDEL